MKSLKTFCVVLLCFLGAGLIGCAIGFPIYAHHKGYDNVVEWIKDTKIFKDEKEEVQVETENGTATLSIEV